MSFQCHVSELKSGYYFMFLVPSRISVHWLKVFLVSCWNSMTYRRKMCEKYLHTLVFTPSSTQSNIEGCLFKSFIKINIPSVSPINKKTQKKDWKKKMIQNVLCNLLWILPKFKPIWWSNKGIKVWIFPFALCQ